MMVKGLVCPVCGHGVRVAVTLEQLPGTFSPEGPMATEIPQVYDGPDTQDSGGSPGTTDVEETDAAPARPEGEVNPAASNSTGAGGDQPGQAAPSASPPAKRPRSMQTT